MPHRNKAPASKSYTRRAPSAPDSAFLRVDEVASFLGICSRTVTRLCKRGELNYVMITPTCFRVRRSAVDEFIARREMQAVQS